MVGGQGSQQPGQGEAECGCPSVLSRADGGRSSFSSMRGFLQDSEVSRPHPEGQSRCSEHPPARSRVTVGVSATGLARKRWRDPGRPRGLRTNLVAGPRTGGLSVVFIERRTSGGSRARAKARRRVGRIGVFEAHPFLPGNVRPPPVRLVSRPEGARRVVSGDRKPGGRLRKIPVGDHIDACLHPSRGVPIPRTRSGRGDRCDERTGRPPFSCCWRD